MIVLPGTFYHWNRPDLFSQDKLFMTFIALMPAHYEFYETWYHPECYLSSPGFNYKM